MDEEDAKNLEKMASGGAILILGAFATKAIMYFYRILVAQQLGTEAYGILTQGLAVFWITMTLSTLGIASGIQRHVSDYLGKERKEKIPGVLWASLTTSIPFSLISATILFLSADLIALKVFSEPGLSTVIRIFALAVPFEMLYNNGASLTMAFREMRYITYVDKIYRSLATFGLTVLLIYLGYGLEGAIIAQFAAMVTSALLMLYFAQFKVFPFLRRKFEWEGHERKKLLSYSWPIFLSGVVGLSTSWADTVLLGYFSVSATVGVYNAAMPTANILSMFASQISNVLFPTVSEYYGKGEKEKSVELASISLKWIYFFTFPGLLMMFLYPTQILNLLFGKEYTGGAIALSVLGAAYFINTLMNHAGIYIKSEDMTKLQLYNSVFISVLNIILNAALIPGFSFYGLVIPEMGLGGAAIATAISLSLGSLLAVLEAYFLFGVQPYRIRRFLPATVSALLSSALVYFAFKQLFVAVPKLMLFPALFCFGTMYILFYILLGGVTDNDLIIIRLFDDKTKLNLEKYLKIIEKYSLV